MSADRQRALWELREFREQVKDFQKRIREFPSDTPPERPAGVMPPSRADRRKDIGDKLDTLLGTIGMYEVELQSRG